MAQDQPQVDTPGARRPSAASMRSWYALDHQPLYVESPNGRPGPRAPRGSELQGSLGKRPPSIAIYATCPPHRSVHRRKHTIPASEAPPRFAIWRYIVADWSPSLILMAGSGSKHFAAWHAVGYEWSWSLLIAARKCYGNITFPIRAYFCLLEHPSSR